MKHTAQTLDAFQNLSPEKRALLRRKVSERLKGGGSGTRIPRRSGSRSAPLTFAQQGMWLTAQLEPGTPVYNRPAALRLTGPLDLGALKSSLDALVARHPALGYRFLEDRGTPVQRHGPPREVSMAFKDLTVGGSAECAQKLQRLYAEEAALPFDLENGPLLRTILCSLGPVDHVLLVLVHHIVFDGWSMDLFVQELAILYGATIAGDSPGLPDLPIRYTDFAAWQREQLTEEVVDRLMSYWQDRIDGLEVLELPTDHVRPARPAHRGTVYRHVLPRALTRAARETAQREDLTLFMFLLSAYQLLMHRYSGSQDVAVGSPVAGRQHLDTEPLIGTFINTLLLRTRFDEAMSVGALLQEVREMALGAYAHQELPFELFVQRLDPPREPGRVPLYSVYFQLRSMSSARKRVRDLTIEHELLDAGIARLDLHLEVLEYPEELVCLFEYDTELFEPSTVKRMAGHFERLVEGLTGSREQPAVRLPMLTRSERSALLDALNRTDRPAPPERCIHELIEAQAQRTPGRVAVAQNDETLSYRQLNAEADGLAQRLISESVGPGARVGICMDRGLRMATSLLAVLKAGAAYVPLDPSLPDGRLMFILEDSGVGLLLTGTAIAPRFASWQGRVHCVDDESSEGPPAGVEPSRPVTGDDLAYVIYTSGSTGVPKGVAVRHSSLVNYVRFAGPEYGIGVEDRVLQFASLSFDAAAEEIFTSWAHGATLVLRTDDMLDSVPAFLGRCVQWRLTAVSLPTAFWHELVAELHAADLDWPEALRLVIIGGEQAQPERLMQWMSRIGPDVRLLNTYGPTEATIVATWCDLSSLAGKDGEPEVVPIGRPVANTRVYVLDSHLEPVPPGVPGELCIAGAGVAEGYLNHPDLTAERFVHNPYGDDRAPRLYLTGDRARVRPDGLLEYLGRSDRQIKLRGYRIEPQEIEAALRRHPQVREAVVTVYSARLVGYVVVSQHAPAERELREFLNPILPVYMIPSWFVFLESLPTTGTGKVDLGALPDPGPMSDEPTTGATEPTTELEAILVKIWSEILERSDIGVTDDFFELGGHSLMATQMMSRVRSRLAVEVPLRRLFEQPTVKGLARMIQQEEGVSLSRTRGPDETAATGDKADVFPLSFAQQRLWFLDRFEPDSGLYNVPKAFRLEGPLDESMLEDAINRVIDRHEALRTTFHDRGGQPVQAVAPSRPLALSVVDLSTGSDADPEDRVTQYLGEEAARPFDLSRGPLIRAGVIRLADHRCVFTLTLHHIVSDGWSMGVLFRELSEYYRAFAARELPGLDALPIQYADYSVWQRGWMQGEELRRQLGYWRERLEGAATLELPTDRRRPRVQSFSGSRCDFQVPADLTENLRSLASEKGATLYMLVLAVFQVLLHRYSGQDDILVGTPIAGRNRAEIEGLIGFFVNSLVIRTDCSDRPTISELLARTRESALGAYAHQDLPFERLVEELQPGRDLSRNPIFQVVFALQNAPKSNLRFPGVSVNEVGVGTDTAKFDLSLFLTEVKDGMSGSLVYNTCLFEKVTAERFVRQYVELLNSVVADPEVPIAEIRMCPEDERKRQILELNATQTDYPRDVCIHQLFEDWVDRDPDAVALVSGGQSVTYGVLNTRANLLAHYLLENGVDTGSMVGLCMRRGVDMVVGLLGILKAGAVYVPLDPEYPQQRLLYMMEDTRLSLLLTQTALRDQIPACAGQTVCLDGDWDDIATGSPRNPNARASADGLAYVMYTSGSTGQPKGVCVTHRGVVRLVRNTNYIAIQPNDVFLLLAPISFDASTFELWGSLLNGARLVIHPPEIPLLEELGASIREEGITVLWLTAALFHEMVDRQLDVLAGVRCVLAGGEALSVRHVERAIARLGEGQCLINGYGPTENTTFTCCHVMDRTSVIGRSVPIGRPVSNTHVYVLDERMEPVPMGVPGELYIGGDGLARGYLNEETLTRERFCADPFDAASTDRLYRSGDRVRFLSDDTLEFLGRTDHQVKIRGHRIEPGEAEAVLRQSPAVREALVMVREDVPGERELVAYVVPVEEDTDTSGLRAFMKEQVPDYMVPSGFVAMTRLPRTANGKIDREALPRPVSMDVARRDERALTPVEEMLAEVWAEVLGAAVSGIHLEDNFFEQGGHSLKATQLMSRVNDLFGVDLPVRTIFSTPTLEGFALAIVEQMALSVEDME